MAYSDVIGTLALITDIGIFVILVIEFNYDKMAYEKEQFHKKRRKRYDFERLTTGEMK